MLGKVQKMVDYALKVARDDSHGYSQVRRWPSQGTDFDCSSLMYEAAHQAGYSVPTSGTRYTGTMLRDFAAAGFKALPFDGNLSDLDPGDIMLNCANHTEMYVGDGKFVGAHSSETGGIDGKPGDQTGREISVVNAYDYPWNYVLVPPKDSASTAKPSTTARLFGIDVSSNQPERIVRDVVNDFAIVKMSGNPKGYAWDYVNPYAAQQAKDAAFKHGLLGLYHFAYGMQATTEADFFIEQVRKLGYLGKAMLVLDYEAGATSKGSTWVKKFCERVKEKAGYAPVIYASGSVIVSQNLFSLGYPIWCANYYKGYEEVNGYDTSDMRIYGGCEKAVLWQFTSRGKLSGYGGNLDLNVFHGGKDAFKALMGPQATAKEESVTARKLSVDGVMGPLTISELQRQLGCTVTKKMDKATVKALQRALNAGTVAKGK